MKRITIQLNQIQRLFFLSRYNDSQIVITVQAENSFFIYFQRITSLTDKMKQINLAKSLLQRAY
jgi:hypothetical protein